MTPREVAKGVMAHQSEFMQTNAVVAEGRTGVVLIDAGVRGDEMACLENPAPRYGTARCGATVRKQPSDAGAKARVAELIPPDIVRQVPLELLGLITDLPAETAHIPWDGPQLRITEHQTHAPAMRPC